jgi:hypothetical protein
MALIEQRLAKREMQGALVSPTGQNSYRAVLAFTDGDRHFVPSSAQSQPTSSIPKAWAKMKTRSPLPYLNGSSQQVLMPS